MPASASRDFARMSRVTDRGSAPSRETASARVFRPVHDAVNVAIRILEPSHAHLSRDVNVAVVLGVRHVVAFEFHAFLAEGTNECVDLGPDEPGDRRRLIGTGEL